MLYFILPLTITLSLMFTFLTHPLSMGLTLLTQTIAICVLSGLHNFSFWFSYILFLIFLGGMLILFIYMASLASNEAFEVSLPLPVTLCFFSTILSLILFFIDPMVSPSSKSYTFSSLSFLVDKISPMLTTSSMIFSAPPIFFTIFVILYLLLTLIVVVKIINNTSNPLRFSN
uniref:NADH-ubiquinone oxidoreductase chain 6 n=1 Tax=Parastacus brasiliensis TaxID=108041 RepID=A0A411ATS5_9EUCA|nr:NADH dehydrogenase subunit 6 [Parastacus brasiliensis]